MGRMPVPEFVLRLRERVGHELLPMAGATGVVRDPQGRILLGLRADTGDWALPSGIIEPFEQPAHALAREIAEETGVSVTVLVAVSATGEITYPNGDRACYLDFTFTCTYLAGSARPLDGENEQVGWFALDALPQLRPSSAFRLDKALAYAGTTWFAPVTSNLP